MRLLLSIALFVGAFLLQGQNAFAQLPTPGNVDWEELWVVTPPTTLDPTDPNAWMFGNNRYTGLAYDKWNDVVYIVNPGTCTVGTVSYNCMRVYAWNAETGTEATSIQNPTSGTPAGQIYVNPNVVDGGFAQGRYAIFKIDLDDQGRIYACNAVAPVFGLCYPGPPPDCDPDFLTQGPWKLYRWDSPFGDVENIYQTGGSIHNPEMTWLTWGTALDVVGQEHTAGQSTFDSVRVFTSGGKFYHGYTTVNDEVNVFLYDDRPTRPYEFRLGLRILHSASGSGFAAHGIAATGASMDSPIYVDASFRPTTLIDQVQTNTSFPQTYTNTLNDTLPSTVTGSSGAIAYFVDDRYNMPYLIAADGVKQSSTTVRVVDLGTGPAWQNKPSQATPQFGSYPLSNFTGEDNWISDVDYKIWWNDNPEDSAYGFPYLQVFVLMSSNGIACYRSRQPITDPVEMTTFRGIVDSDNIALLWQTAAEASNKGFEVYRSFNAGNDWEKIGFVPGGGTTSSASEYTFRDPVTEVHTNVGTVQYRLKQIDFDGHYEWTSAIDVFLNATPTGIVLYQNYPNPFNPSTKISYQIQEPAFVTIKVYNSLGDEVATLVNQNVETGLHNVDFHAEGLPSGTYMYQMNANGKRQQKKMVLTK